MTKVKKNLGEGSIGRLLVSLAFPAIIAQLVNVLYNIVDRIFIGRMDNGEIAMAGVGVAFPIIMIISENWVKTHKKQSKIIVYVTIFQISQ